MSEMYCPGGAEAPIETRGRDMPKSSGEGQCAHCQQWRRLTAGGLMRRHKVQAPEQSDEGHQHHMHMNLDGTVPVDEDLTLPNDGEPRPKTNPTPDLTDEEYLEQMALIAQSIAVMPAQREGLPNVTTPPPIRPLWAKFMLSLGIRIHPQLATHKLKSTGPAAAGNFGPRQHVPLKRETMNSADLMQTWKEMNPESFQGIRSGSMTREALIANMPEQMQELLRQAEEMARQEQQQSGEAPPQ